MSALLEIVSFSWKQTEGLNIYKWFILLERFDFCSGEEFAEFIGLGLHNWIVSLLNIYHTRQYWTFIILSFTLISLISSFAGSERHGNDVQMNMLSTWQAAHRVSTIKFIELQHLLHKRILDRIAILYMQIEVLKHESIFELSHDLLSTGEQLKSLELGQFTHPRDLSNWAHDNMPCH